MGQPPATDEHASRLQVRPTTDDRRYADPRPQAPFGRRIPTTTLLLDETPIQTTNTGQYHSTTTTNQQPPFAYSGLHRTIGESDDSRRCNIKKALFRADTLLTSALN
uniref:Uncharacterized protein n=1 Tax=Schizaphis graminum TaxID=13262 RepID=A0A2S2PQU6_SCHGA